MLINGHGRASSLATDVDRNDENRLAQIVQGLLVLGSTRPTPFLRAQAYVVVTDLSIND
jgi:hypothetical protein